MLEKGISHHEINHSLVVIGNKQNGIRKLYLA